METAKRFIKQLVVERLRRQDAARRSSVPGGFNGLPPHLWGYEADSSGALCVQQYRTKDLLAEYGSPLYVVNLPCLRETQEAFLSPFRKHFSRAFLGTSYKTNPVPTVLDTLHKCGTYAEVISEFELWLAGKLGLDGTRIIVNGPGKTRDMIRRAVEMDVKIINVDGLAEIDAIADEARRIGRRQPVGVRVTTSVGWSSQFGVPIADGAARTAYERISRNDWLVPVGVHLHIGTGLKSVDLYVRAIREVLEFSVSLEKELGIALDLYDLGGGFGVPTVRGKDAWDDRMIALGYPPREALVADCPTPEQYASRIADAFGTLLPHRPSPEIVLEAGRAITSRAQSLLLSVITVKEGNGGRRLILDGGKNITMPLGWETHRIFPGEKLLEPHLAQTDLYGPLCHPGDIVARNLQLPLLESGDHIAIMDAGAYFVPNQMNFSLPRPAIVAVENGQARIIRRRESFDDIVRLDDIR